MYRVYLFIKTTDVYKEEICRETSKIENAVVYSMLRMSLRKRGDSFKLEKPEDPLEYFCDILVDLKGDLDPIKESITNIHTMIGVESVDVRPYLGVEKNGEENHKVDLDILVDAVKNDELLNEKMDDLMNLSSKDAYNKMIEGIETKTLEPKTSLDDYII